MIGTTSKDFANLGGRLGRLFFAGEATDETWFGFMMGGYFTGESKGKAIERCIRGESCPTYPKDSCSRATEVVSIYKSIVLFVSVFSSVLLNFIQ